MKEKYKKLLKNRRRKNEEIKKRKIKHGKQIIEKILQFKNKIKRK